MGISIDEAIEKYKKLSEEAENNATSYAHLEKFKRELKHNTEARYCELSKEECLADAIEYRQLAEWLEKYQKIEQIVEHWACCGNPSDSMIAISEVLEDVSN
jgi:CRISPR/Cas system endoribonuclease Cas6 (RAMP superfamily)